MTADEARGLAALASEAEFKGPEGTKWVERLAPRRQELAEAAGVLVTDGDAEAAAALGARTWRLWLLTGDVAGGRRLLSAALDVDNPAPSRARALALYGDGLLAFRQGAQKESRARNDQALAEAREVGDAEAEALALVGLSRVAFRSGDYARVRSLAAEARKIVRPLDQAADAAPLHMLAAGTRLEGDYDAAIDLYKESLELSHRLKDGIGVAMELHNIGHVELHRGNVEAARGQFAACQELRNPDDPYDVAMTHLNQAAMAFADGDHDGTAKELAQMKSSLDAAAIVLDPDDAFEVTWLEQRLH